MTRSSEFTVSLPSEIRRLLVWGGGSIAIFVAFVVGWSTLAEITTTVRLPGALSPSAPSHDVQHESGGRVASLHVAIHEEVEAGDLLLELDVSDERVQMAALEEQAEILQAELDAILPRLLGSTPKPIETLKPSSVALAYATKDEAFLAQLEQLRAERAGLARRADILAERHQSQSALLELTRDRFERGADLSQKGHLTKVEFETLARELHSGEATLLEMRAEAAELDSRSTDIALSIARLEHERREELATTRLSYETQLIDTRTRIARLSESIERASVYAPVTGKVTDLLIDTPGLVAPPGATLLTLTQHVSDPQIDLFVAPSYIDQVRVGQEGLLTITSLPQRTAPRLRVTITDIAREPVKDPQGNPVHYLARAGMNRADLKDVKAKLGAEFRLSVGMPINAAMNGRNTTLWQFVTGPFTGLLASAFED